MRRTFLLIAPLLFFVFPSGAELSWTDRTVETPCTSLIGCSEATLHALGGSKVAGVMLYAFGVMVIAADSKTEVMDIQLVVERSDRSKDTMVRNGISVKSERGFKFISEVFMTADVSVTSVLSLDTVEKTRDGKVSTPHKFR